MPYASGDNVKRLEHRIVQRVEDSGTDQISGDGWRKISGDQMSVDQWLLREGKDSLPAREAII